MADAQDAAAGSVSGATDTGASADSANSSRGLPLTETQWLDFFDKDGRLLNEAGFKSKVFKGGIAASARKLVWPYLLGYFDFQSTYREREVVLKERRIEYAALKARWKQDLRLYEEENSGMMDPAQEEDDQYQFMFIQAQVNAMRYDIDEKEAHAAIKTIEKDVPRTDRKGNYFCDDHPERLVWLRDILITYAVFHPTVGYAQGMNDVLSMILAVMDHEADAYWCFRNFLATIQEDFMAKGMMDKLEKLRDLFSFMDPEVYKHFESVDGGDMVFCHRWLLLSFKREFSFEDAVRLFEILCSHHLELSSIEAEKARDQEMRLERQRDSTGNEISTDAAETKALNHEYTFELFVCLAILRMYRDDLLKTGDVADIFTVINGLVGKMTLDDVLSMAETVFFDYCRKSVTNPDESFLLLDVPTE